MTGRNTYMREPKKIHGIDNINKKLKWISGDKKLYAEVYPELIPMGSMGVACTKGVMNAIIKDMRNVRESTVSFMSRYIAQEKKIEYRNMANGFIKRLVEKQKCMAGDERFVLLG